MPTAEAQTYSFQAEIRSLLDIVVHSLYTEKEIFLRELVSNASDALERMRHLGVTQHPAIDAEAPLAITVTTDDAAKTLTIEDSGIGMTRTELIENLGTIAHSGSKTFQAAIGVASDPPPLIGQFGVGFYSVFMVASKVDVYTRSGRVEEPGHVWTSDGVGTFEVAKADHLRRGTRVVLTLKDDCADFLRDWKVREILERYSAFLRFPIHLNGTLINAVEALWLRNRSETTEAQYQEFYQFLAHAYDEPRLHLHFSADAPLSINALLFVPQTNQEKRGLGRSEPGVALYSRRVLIDPQPKELLPAWLRFLKGVVDSEDVALNISRETMQDRSIVAKLRGVLIVRFLRFLEEEAKQRPDVYADFYREFGHLLKEGVALDFAHREQLSKLLRFESSATEPGHLTSFAEYVTRMPAEQPAIYYLMGPSRATIEAGPYLEGFKARGFEVLYGHEPVDEYVMHDIHTFEAKSILAADHADVHLPASGSREDAPSEADVAPLITWMRGVLDARVVEIKASDRLLGSPMLAVSTDRVASPHMRRMMKAMNHQAGSSTVHVNLEINPQHLVIQRLVAKHATSPDLARLVAQQLLDNALLAAGLLDDPTSMITRLNTLLQHV